MGLSGVWGKNYGMVLYSMTAALACVSGTYLAYIMPSRTRAIA